MTLKKNRNKDRFTGDFMFELTRDEITDISQIVTSSRIKYSKRVTAFSEQGGAMLFSHFSWLFAPCSMPLEKASYGRKAKGKRGVRT